VNHVRRNYQKNMSKGKKEPGIQRGKRAGRRSMGKTGLNDPSGESKQIKVECAKTVKSVNGYKLRGG